MAIVGFDILYAQVGWDTDAFGHGSNSRCAPPSYFMVNFPDLISLLFKLTGPAKYLGKKNLLAFDFTHVQLRLFNRAIYSGGFRGGKSGAVNFSEQSVAKLPFFAFFIISKSFIAARGRGGGLALWVKLS